MSLAALSISEETTDKDWKAISNELEAASPEAVLHWAIEKSSPDVARSHQDQSARILVRAGCLELHRKARRAL